MPSGGIGLRPGGGGLWPGLGLINGIGGLGIGGGKEPQGIGGINGENIGRRGPGGGGNNLGDLIPGGGGRILGNIPGCGTGIPRGRNMSGGGGARRPISGGGFIVLPRPFPFGTPDTLFHGLVQDPYDFNTRNSKQLFYKMADRTSTLASFSVFVQNCIQITDNVASKFLLIVATSPSMNKISLYIINVIYS